MNPQRALQCASFLNARRRLSVDAKSVQLSIRMPSSDRSYSSTLPASYGRQLDRDSAAEYWCWCASRALRLYAAAECAWMGESEPYRDQGLQPSCCGAN
jgi:hypothetical protein